MSKSLASLRSARANLLIAIALSTIDVLTGKVRDEADRPMVVVTNDFLHPLVVPAAAQMYWCENSETPTILRNF